MNLLRIGILLFCSANECTLTYMAALTGYAKHIVLGGVFLTCAATIGFFAGRQGQRAAVDRGAKEELANTASVLLAVRALARLETIGYHMERIIDLKNRSPLLFGLVAADDAILLVAAGDVIAGIDLAKMTDRDVTLTEQRRLRGVRLRLPAPEILSASLDNRRTYVHSRKTDLLAQRGDQIESRARQLAERAIRDAAVDAGILNRARQSAEQTLSMLMRSLGYNRIEFEWTANAQTAQ